MVGYNGIGKSTILNIFYFFISQQWEKLFEQDFDEIFIKVRNVKKPLYIKKPNFFSDNEDDIYHFRGASGRRYLTKSKLLFLAKEALLQRAKQSDNVMPIAYVDSPLKDARFLQNKLNIPTSIARELAMELKYISIESEDNQERIYEDISIADSYLSKNLKGRVLYLPTYRRIEKDLKAIFPEIEQELQRSLTMRSRFTDINKSYVELVEFGMEDVKEKLKDRLENIKAFALSQINNLTTRYLRDVIRNVANKYDSIKWTDVDNDYLDIIFAKVDNHILNDKDKENIKEVVYKIHKKIELEEIEKYVAHYVMCLVDAGKNILKNEESIKVFTELCNSYLYGKYFEFDNVGYNVTIRHNSGRPLEIKDLSSGEKQIVSLFSHLILDDEINNYIIIDEPELSLSVEWQKRFLEDISKLPTCKFIAAVTHSPFIFQNSLDQHAVDILESSSTK